MLMDNTNSEKNVVKHNLLLESSYRLKLQSEKLILCFLSKIDSRKQIPKIMTITAKEFSYLMNIPISNAYKELYKAVNHLYEETIELKPNEIDEIIEFRWIQTKVRYKKGDGQVTITWGDEILKYISNITGNFTEFKIRIIADLRSSYSLRLYQLLMRHIDRNERYIDINTLRLMLRLNVKYPEFRDLNRWVIKPAVNELNKKSDLSICYQPVRQGKKVVSLIFYYNEFKKLQMKN